MFFLYVLIPSVIHLDKWLCNQVEIQYQIIYDQLSNIKTQEKNGLLTIISNYWKENHKYCTQNELFDIN